jgi:hypothetical protein
MLCESLADLLSFLAPKPAKTVATNMNKKIVMLLIYNREEEFKDVDPIAEWPLEEAGTKDEKTKHESSSPNVHFTLTRE